MRSRTLALVLCAPLLGASYWPMSNDSDVAAGQEAFGRGDYARAVASFREALAGKGERARLHFDLGTALVQRARSLPEGTEREGQLDLAIVSLRLATTRSGGDLRERAHYNLGNALLLRARIDEAIASYRQVLRANPDHDDARHNLELALLARASGPAPLDALRDLGAIPAVGESAEDSVQAEGDASGAGEPVAQGVQGAGASASQGEQGSGASQEAGRAEGTGVETEEAEEARADSKRRPRPQGDRRLSLEQKLEALERRSGELRRANMLRKTESRLRSPDVKRRDQ